MSQISNYALVKLCQWSYDAFMLTAGVKEELDMYIDNVELTNFLSDKCPEYHDLTNSFVWRFRYVSHRSSHDVIFDLYDKAFRMKVQEFSVACIWGTCLEPHKSD